MATTTARTYYVAVNLYRGAADCGFANTWRVYRCRNKSQQREVLTRGLPVDDQHLIDDQGRLTPCYSTVGIRPATRTEIREAIRLADAWGQPIPWVD